MPVVMMPNIGSFNQKRKSVVIKDGKITIGEKFFHRVVSFDFSANCWKCRVTEKEFTSLDRHINREVNIFTKDEKIEDVVKLNGSYDPDSCYVNRDNCYAVKIADGSHVIEDDYVWIWRNTPNYPALVRKIVTWAYLNQIQCTYEDNFFPRKEDPSRLYSSRENALAANPDRVERMEHAWKRHGRILEAVGIPEHN